MLLSLLPRLRGVLTLIVASRMILRQTSCQFSLFYEIKFRIEKSLMIFDERNSRSKA